MRLPDLLRRIEERIEDARAGGYSAPVDKVLGVVLAELRGLAPGEGPAHILTASETAKALGLSPKTVTHWCQEGRFPSAYRTSTGERGRWCIPSSDVDARRAQLKEGGR